MNVMSTHAHTHPEETGVYNAKIYKFFLKKKKRVIG